MTNKTFQLDVTQADFATLMFGLSVAITDIEATAAGMHPDDSDLIESNREHIILLRSLQKRLTGQYSKQQEGSR